MSARTRCRSFGSLAVMLLALVASGAACRASSVPETRFGDLAFQQHAGAVLPGDVRFADENGASVLLSSFLGGAPVILVFEYLQCPNLCGLVLGGLFEGLGATSLTSGRDYRVLAISIDPKEGPAQASAARDAYRTRFGDAAVSGWHFLTGSESDVRRIANAVGFPYQWDASIGQYAHPAGLVVATPAGVLSRYLFGVDFQPLDLRLALAEAAGGAIAPPAARLLLLCYAYDPRRGGYSLAIGRALQIAGALTVLAAGGFILHQLRREARG